MILQCLGLYDFRVSNMVLRKATKDLTISSSSTSVWTKSIEYQAWSELFRDIIIFTAVNIR